jgi:hypothetical protein
MDPSVCAGSVADRPTTDNGGHQRSLDIPEPAARSAYRLLTSDGGQERRGGRVSPPGCREPHGLSPTRRLSPRAGLTQRSSWSRRSQVPSSAFLPTVPPRATSSGHQRIVTVNWRRPLDWVPASELGWGRRPKLHGMQGVRGSNPLNSTLHQRSKTGRGTLQGETLAARGRGRPHRQWDGLLLDWLVSR